MKRDLKVELKSIYEELDTEKLSKDDNPVSWSNIYLHLEYKYIRTYLFLYERLSNPEFNISHKKLPTFDEHVKFINSKPYKGWWLVYANIFYNTLVGSVYLTNENEIGIYLIKKYRKCGIGSEILKQIEPMCEGEILYANINVENESSKKFFTKNGFKLYEGHIPREGENFNRYVTYRKYITKKYPQTE